jgi:hypothetical protein
MKKALAGVLAVALVGVLAGSAMAQVPNIQVYFDLAHTQTQTNCGDPGSPTFLYVVMNNWNFNISGVDFSIAYPPSLAYVADQVPDPLTQIPLGASPGGLAIAYANCCFLDGTQSVEIDRVLAIWTLIVAAPADRSRSLSAVTRLLARHSPAPFGRKISPNTLAWV